MVHEAFADDGVTIKRWRPRARGRANRIEKRTTHITLLLRPIEGVESGGPRSPSSAGAVVEEKPNAGAARRPLPPVRRPRSRPRPRRPPEAEAEAAEQAPEAEAVEEPEAEAVVVDDEVEAPEDVAEDDEAAADSEPAADEQDDDDEPSAQADGKE